MQFNKTLVCVVCLCGMGLLLQSWMPGVAMGAPQSDEDLPGAEAEQALDFDSDLDLPLRSDEAQQDKPLVPRDGGKFGESSSGEPSRMGSRDFMPFDDIIDKRSRMPVSDIFGSANRSPHFQATETAHRQLFEAFHALKSAKDDSARTTAKAKVRTQLQTQFDLDLKRREEELKKVEERVKALREQFEKRKSAQASIVDLRLQTLVNEASGLGFPGSSILGSLSSPFAPPADAHFHDFDRTDPFNELSPRRRDRGHVFDTFPPQADRQRSEWRGQPGEQEFSRDAGASDGIQLEDNVDSGSEKDERSRKRRALKRQYGEIPNKQSEPNDSFNDDLDGSGLSKPQGFSPGEEAAESSFDSDLGDSR